MLACVVALVATAPAAFAVPANVSVGNAPPIVASVTLPSVTAIAGGVTPVTATIVVTDGNGHADITGATVTVIRPDGLTVHVATAPATLVAASGTAATFTYSFSMLHSDVPAVAGSTYKVVVVATDAAGARGDNAANPATFPFTKVVALEVATGPLTFGSSLLPGARGDATPMRIVNRGNVRIDVAVSGTALKAEKGTETIPPASVGYDLSPSFTQRTALTTSAATITAFDLPPGLESARDLYWMLSVPQGIPPGAYGGTLVIDALEG